MSQPVFLRSGISVALVRLLQGIFPALVVPASLYWVAKGMGLPFSPDIATVAAVASVLSLIIFQPRTSDVPPLGFDKTAVGMDLLVRWASVLALLYLLSKITVTPFPKPHSMLVIWAFVSAVLIFGGNLLLLLTMQVVVFSKRNERSAVIVGVNTASLLLADRLREHPEYCTRVVGFFDDRSSERLEPMRSYSLLGQMNDLVAHVQSAGIDVIFISLPLRHIKRVMDLLDELRDSTASIYYVPDVYVFDLIQSRSGDVGGVPIIAMCETPFFGYRGVLKRLTDIFFTLCILMLVMPFMLVIALLVKLTSRGPVIFKQRRYGLDGEEILVYKFRSMTVAEDGASVVQAKKEDARVTTVGRYLRRLSLDELPQLINVLQGRMSLVGPRPHAVAHNEIYRQLIKGYMMRHKVLPGITGLAQVSGCRGETPELSQMQARVNYDLDYLRHWSPALDVRILIRTFLLIFRGDKQAY